MGLLTDQEDYSGILQDVDQMVMDLEAVGKKLMKDENVVLTSNNNIFRILASSASIAAMAVYNNANVRDTTVKSAMMALSALVGIQMNAFLKGKDYVDEDRDDSQVIVPITGVLYYLMAGRADGVRQINYKTAYEAALGMAAMVAINYIFN